MILAAHEQYAGLATFLIFSEASRVVFGLRAVEANASSRWKLSEGECGGRCDSECRVSCRIQAMPFVTASSCMVEQGEVMVSVALD